MILNLDLFFEEPQSCYASPDDMSSSVENEELQPEEKYEIAVSWATMTGTWALMVVICGARVSVLLFIVSESLFIPRVPEWWVWNTVWLMMVSSVIHTKIHPTSLQLRRLGLSYSNGT